MVQPPTSCCAKAPHQANISMVTNVQLIDSDCSCSSYDNALHIYISTSIRLIYTRTMNHVAMILSVRNHTLPETKTARPPKIHIVGRRKCMQFLFGGLCLRHFFPSPFELLVSGRVPKRRIRGSKAIFQLGKS